MAEGLYSIDFNNNFSAHAHFPNQSLYPQKFKRLDFNGSHFFMLDRKNYTAACAIIADTLKDEPSGSNTAVKTTSCCLPIFWSFKKKTQ